MVSSGMANNRGRRRRRLALRPPGPVASSRSARVHRASPAASRPSSCPASSADPAPAPIRNCEPQSLRAPPASCRCGSRCRPLPLRPPHPPRLHRLDLLGRHRQRLRQRRRVALRRILHGHREDGSRLQVAPVLRPCAPGASDPSFIFAIFASGSCGDCTPCSTSSCPSGTGQTAPAPLASASQSPDASASRRTNAS